MGNCDDEIDQEINCVIDQILREDRLESMSLNLSPDPCDQITEVIEIGTDDCNVNSCAVETSARFSIRILEALRAVQRKKSSQSRPSCTMEEVVQYIRRHFHHDGDLCSQVETALNQVTGQGFVLRMGANRYHLMGPFACSVLRPPGSCGNRSICQPPEGGSRCRRRRGRRRGTSEKPIANSTFASSVFEDRPSMNPAQFSAGSNVVDRLHQGRSNLEISFVNGHGEGEEFEEDRTISVVEEINPQAPNEPLRRPGGNEGVVREHSSDDFMYCNAPVNEERSRGQSSTEGSEMKDSSSSSSISDTAISRSGRRPSRRRRNVFNCSSDADVSEEDDDESSGAKPWVRNCQNLDSPRLNRRVQKSCARSCCD